MVAAGVWHKRVITEGALRDGRVVRAAIADRLRPSNEPYDERSQAGHGQPLGLGEQLVAEDRLRQLFFERGRQNYELFLKNLRKRR